jgi:hypothetical protein
VFPSLFKISGGLWLERKSLWRARPRVGNSSLHQGEASLLERAYAYALMLRLTAITLLVRWPRRAADYEYLGLKVDLFLEEILDYAARAIRPLGVFFPQRPLLRLARIALRIS